MEICMTAEEFAANSISKYNRRREGAKYYMIAHVNDALNNFSGKSAKVLVKLYCTPEFQAVCESAVEWLKVVDEVQEELVQKGFRTEWETYEDGSWSGKLTIEVAKYD